MFLLCLSPCTHSPLESPCTVERAVLWVRYRELLLSSTQMDRLSLKWVRCNVECLEFWNSCAVSIFNRWVQWLLLLNSAIRWKATLHVRIATAWNQTFFLFNWINKIDDKLHGQFPGTLMVWGVYLSIFLIGVRAFFKGLFHRMETYLNSPGNKPGDL